MNELEKVLQGMRPTEPSSGYVDRGLALIAASGTRRNLASVRWRYATAVLALLFLASFAMNVMSWLEPRRDASAPTFVSSVLRQEGEVMVREIRYERTGLPGDER